VEAAGPDAAQRAPLQTASRMSLTRICAQLRLDQPRLHGAGDITCRLLRSPSGQGNHFRKHQVRAREVGASLQLPDTDDDPPPRRSSKSEHKALLRRADSETQALSRNTRMALGPHGSGAHERTVCMRVVNTTPIRSTSLSQSGRAMQPQEPPTSPLICARLHITLSLVLAEVQRFE